MKESGKILLCTDLDRTLLPNGHAPESRLARRVFACIAARDEVMLVYVTGRDITLMKQAITDYSLPTPDFSVCDVGTSIYHLTSVGWTLLEDWQYHIAADWKGLNAYKLEKLIPVFPHLRLQNSVNIKTYKLSYYVSPAEKMEKDIKILKQELDGLKIKYHVVSSIDETEDKGLVDILPASAGKLKAINFLVKKFGIQSNNVYFSGDSGNDYDVLLSEYRTTLVANATSEFKNRVHRDALTNGSLNTLYIASGALNSDLNGNYAAGIVEGFMHYFPYSESWIDWEKLHEYTNC